MSFTYDLTTNLGVVRFRVNDVTQATALFSDEEITAVLAIESGTWGASAALLERIALDQVLLMKAVKILGFSVDGSKVADTILKIAARYRDQALITENASGNLWDSAEIASTPWAGEQIIVGDLLRNGG